MQVWMLIWFILRVCVGTSNSNVPYQLHSNYCARFFLIEHNSTSNTLEKAKIIFDASSSNGDYGGNDNRGTANGSAGNFAMNIWKLKNTAMLTANRRKKMPFRSSCKWHTHTSSKRLRPTAFEWAVRVTVSTQYMYAFGIGFLLSHSLWKKTCFEWKTELIMTSSVPPMFICIAFFCQKKKCSCWLDLFSAEFRLRVLHYYDIFCPLPLLLLVVFLLLLLFCQHTMRIHELNG